MDQRDIRRASRSPANSAISGKENGKVATSLNAIICYRKKNPDEKLLQKGKPVSIAAGVHMEGILLVSVTAWLRSCRS